MPYTDYHNITIETLLYRTHSLASTRMYINDVMTQRCALAASTHSALLYTTTP